ncbi:uncharacterized protein Z518_11217 [Rhinocladiella mackenziei CBS 650.93]|uniref:BRCT domain-containing protein n=1 Tax=Rhinocladiella mackenziei CBS 650.93 TaxID=1442369 RepID=A0A0D2I1B0_9EURO|nr:uncharacterized protein Z518_11217 [Rhinocladiella mackenziei CBS 650.93]KIW99478.1 hypothetical protein Z518_11217 [Rhinocladiella mackenziei CBS 650.93]
MGKTFRNVHLASTNDFPKGWVAHNGGTFAKEIFKDVTHLVASKKAWRRYCPMVREAHRLKTVHIVRLEWLEDSLLTKFRRPLDTTKYEWEQRKVTKIVRKRRMKGETGEKASGESDNTCCTTEEEEVTGRKRTDE